MQRFELRKTQIKLVKIAYTEDATDAINAIQLIFSNGVKSPIITHDSKAPFMHRVTMKEIRFNKAIGGVKVILGDSAILGITFFDQSEKREPFISLGKMTFREL